MKVIEIKNSEGIVELGGVKREANLQLVEDVRVGDYILIHAGCAIQKLDREEAEKTLSYLRQMAEMV
jgi:hydrogenase expression/formation protein HypC